MRQTVRPYSVSVRGFGWDLERTQNESFSNILFLSFDTWTFRPMGIMAMGREGRLPVRVEAGPGIKDRPRRLSASCKHASFRDTNPLHLFFSVGILFVFQVLSLSKFFF
jgi:hypothetical protein